MIRLGKKQDSILDKAVDEISFASAALMGFRVKQKETETEHVVSIEFPGYKKDQINIILENRILRIDVENENEPKESRTRKYREHLVLGEYLDAGNISAAFADGILTITIGKKEVEPKEFKQIEIK
jgi:HSP20 family protein